MNTHHLETESEQKTGTYSRARMLERETEGVAVSQLPSEAEVQQAYEQMFTNMGAYISFLVIGAAASQKQKAAALAISRFDDVRTIGPLAEALEFNDKEVVPMAEKALISLLPRMKATDTALLSPEQRFCLNRALRGKNTELTLAILKAWEQVGDAKAIEEVDKLAHGRGRGGRNPKVVAAAQDCLPFLRQSAERQQIGAQLLRPSEGNLTPSDVLLRPAMPHASTTPSEQLLRSTESPDSLTL